MIKEKYVRPAVESTDIEIGVYGNGYAVIECVHCDIVT